VRMSMLSAVVCDWFDGCRTLLTTLRPGVRGGYGRPGNSRCVPPVAERVVQPGPVSLVKVVAGSVNPQQQFAIELPRENSCPGHLLPAGSGEGCVVIALNTQFTQQIPDVGDIAGILRQKQRAPHRQRKELAVVFGEVCNPAGRNGRERRHEIPDSRPFRTTQFAVAVPVSLKHAAPMRHLSVVLHERLGERIKPPPKLATEEPTTDPTALSVTSAAELGVEA